jgi:hypothetical protein
MAQRDNYGYAEALRIVQRLEPLNADDSSNGNMATFLAAVNTAGRSLERFEASMAYDRKARNQDEYCLDGAIAKRLTPDSAAPMASAGPGRG